MHVIWVIIIGFIAGVIAKLVTPGDNEPKGFILTTIRKSSAPSWRHISDRPSVGTGKIKVPV